jgi:hypothetical protein
MPQDATFVGAKELSTKELCFVHITYENFRCINLNTFMYFQYKYFEYGLCNIGIEFEVHKFTFYMNNESIIFYYWSNSDIGCSHNQTNQKGCQMGFKNSQDW